MKHLTQFFDYIKESTESGNFDADTLNDLLVPISDLGVEYSISDKSTVTEGEFVGSQRMSVDFSLGNFKSTLGVGYSIPVIYDDRIWLFLDELISFKNRLDSDKVLLFFNHSNYGGFKISIIFITGEVEDTDVFKLETLHNELRKKSNVGKTDFYYSMVTTLDKDEPSLNIRISDDYTDRKFSNFLRGIDISQFKIDKEIIQSTWLRDNKGANIKITVK